MRGLKWFLVLYECGLTLAQSACPSIDSALNGLYCPVGEYSSNGVLGFFNGVDNCLGCSIPSNTGAILPTAMPYNAHYTGHSSALYLDRCPWACNTGYFQGLGNCFPGLNCLVPTSLPPYSTVRSCTPTPPCQPGYFAVPASADIMMTHPLDTTSALIRYSVANLTVFGAVGRQCNKEANSLLTNLDGSFDNASFGDPLFAQQSGNSDISVVFDRIFLVLKAVNRTSRTVRTIAGGGNTSLYGAGASVSFALKTLPVPYSYPNMSLAVAVNHLGTDVLIYDCGVMRMVNIATGWVTKIAGRPDVYGYAEGTGDQIMYNSVTSVSLSRDASFALVVDFSMTVRYLNISTRTSSLLAGVNDEASSIDGVGTNAFFFFSSAVAVSNDGKFALVGDCADPNFPWGGGLGYGTIRRVDIASSLVTTIAGDYANAALRDGTGSNAFVFCPCAFTIAADDSYAFFMDLYNFALRTIDLTTYAVTTLDVVGVPQNGLYTATNISPRLGAFPVSISNILGTGSSSMSPTCTPCPVGTYSSVGVCVPCSAGTFSALGASACVTCAAGFYSGVGSSGCIPCASGAYSIAGASACVVCAKGAFFSNGTCFACTNKS